MSSKLNYSIIGPGNKPLFVLTGEGHKDELVWFVGNTLRHFGTRIATTPLPMSLSGQVKRKEEDMLYFPSKVCNLISTNTIKTICQEFIYPKTLYFTVIS